MGTGIARGVSWKDMEIQNLFSGEPIMKLYGKALEICQGLIIHVSLTHTNTCLLYTSPSPRDRTRYRMPSSA